MKTFKDLKFKPHATGEGLAAKLFFKNGYGVSVVRFKMLLGAGSYTDSESEWELAILKGKKSDWEIDYDTSITDDVMGHLEDEEVSEIMKRVQQLSKQ